MRPHSNTTSVRQQRGMSLVEVLVALLIGMLSVVVMYQALYAAKGEANTNAAGAEAQNSGAFALMQLERNLREAGFGMNANAMAGCWVRPNPPRQPNGMSLVPVVIAAGPTPDSSVTLTINSGNSPFGGLVHVLANGVDSTPTGAQVKTNRYGFAVNDVVIYHQADRDCSFGQITGIPAGTNRLDIESASGLTYTGPAGQIVNLGSAPTSNSYEIVGNNLVVTNLLAPGPPTPVELARGVVGLRAEYVKVANGAVSYDSNPPASPAEWATVRAVRVALLMQSGHRLGRPAANGTCTGLPAPPGWMGGGFNLADVSESSCYQYKVFQTVVPLRNQLWSPE